MELNNGDSTGAAHMISYPVKISMRAQWTGETVAAVAANGKQDDRESVNQEMACMRESARRIQSVDQ